MDKKKTKILIEKMNAEAVIPTYAHEGDAGMDLYCNEDITIKPGETVLVKTGLKMAIPEGFEVQIRPRSGISLNTPLRIPNSPGTIDSGYRGEVCIIMQNTSAVDAYGIYGVSDKGNKQGIYKIKKGDRVAQMVVARYESVEMAECEDVASVGTDRNGGFGSTGV